MALLPPPKPIESSFAGDGLRRLVQRRYELRLVERGLASRPVYADDAANDESEDSDRSPLVDRLQDVSGDLQTEIDEWLARVVLVGPDGERFRASEIETRAFRNVWRRAGGERPLPVLSLVPPPPPSSVEGTAERLSPSSCPPGTVWRSTVPPATDEAVATKGEKPMGLTDQQQAVADTMDLSARDAAAKVGCTVGVIYATRSALKRTGKLPKASRRAARVAEGGGHDAPAPEPGVADDALIAPLRAALEQLDVKRARIVAGIVALGGEA